jgi:hypothetical protein
MRSYVYAISDHRDGPLPRQAGIEGEALEEVVFRGVAPVISRHRGAAVAADAAWRCCGDTSRCSRR